MHRRRAGTGRGLRTVEPVTLPLDGITVVEVSSFVAAPLCGVTLAQLGAEVIRVDPIGGAADFRRWPLAESGTSIYWTGLNKGKRSAAIDLRSADGQQLVQRLIVEGDGIVVTNAAGLAWLSHERLAAMRSDVISVQLLGRGDGSTGVDYTVNAAIGFPFVTGPADYAGPINHVLPAWDVCCGLYAALAVTAAVRRRDQQRGRHARPPGAGGRRVGDRRQPRLDHRTSGQRHAAARALATRSSGSTARTSPAATVSRSWLCVDRQALSRPGGGDGHRGSGVGGGRRARRRLQLRR